MRKRIEEGINWVLYDELIASKINAPKHLLGIHDYGEGQIIVVYKPGAIRVGYIQNRQESSQYGAHDQRRSVCDIL